MNGETTSLVYRAMDSSHLKNVPIMEAILSGFWTITECPPPSILINQESRIFWGSINEFAGGVRISFVPTIINVGMLFYLLDCKLLYNTTNKLHCIDF